MTLDFWTLDDVDVTGRTVLVRVDINAPVIPGTSTILDDSRLRSIRPTIEALRKARVVLLSHQSRPGKGDYTTLAAHGKALRRILGHNVQYVDSLHSSQAVRAIRELLPGGILLLENVRFSAEEVALKGKPVDVQARTLLVRTLVPLIDLYVSDAFAAAHRAQASLIGFAHDVPCIAGKLLETEVRFLERATETGRSPRIAVLGGVKVDDSLDIAERMLADGKFDRILTGGGVGNLFLAAQGYDIGARNQTFLQGHVDHLDQDIARAKALLEKYGDRIEVPSDVVTEKKGIRHHLSLDELKGQDLPLFDIGVETVARYDQILRAAGTILLNGPMGKFEDERFALGTREVFSSVAHSQAVSIAGGGHTQVELGNLGFSHRIDHISSGGGALISFLAGHPMPVFDALAENKQRFSSGPDWRERFINAGGKASSLP